MIDLEQRPNAPEAVPDGETPAEAPVRVCVVDLGTNSFHAVIVDARANGAFTLFDKIKEMVQ